MIRLAYGRMLQDMLDQTHGLPRGRLPDLGRRFAAIQAEVRERRSGGEYGFYRLTEQAETVREIRAFADGLGQAHDHVLVLGIGGSALGAKALLGALGKPAWNELDDDARDFFSRLTVLDNVDPDTVAATLRRIDPRRVLVNVISKSGATAETMAQYLVVRAWLDEALGSASHRHLVFTTDPARGPLRALAQRETIATLAVPSDVGGRYSMLSPVGLLPAALIGVDIDALLAGARRAVDRAESEALLANPAALYAALLWAADTMLGARVHVLMPYTDRLRNFGEWYRQLWAESLGKRLDRRGQPVFVGPTPVAAVGASDQHSQVQLFMEGPFDKVVSFIRLERFGEDIAIPGGAGLPAELGCLPGRTLGSLLNAECDATSDALARMGRMNLTLHLPELGAETFGELVMFFQIAAGYAGVWYGVDPFDQPGVELAKELTVAAMGRAPAGATPAPPATGDEA